MPEPNSCTREGCESAWQMSCHHGRWCDAHLLEHLNSDDECRLILGEAMFKLITKGLKPLLDLEAEIFPATMPIIAIAKETYQNVLAEVRPSYEDAGAPYGMDDDAIWRWVGEQYQSHSVSH